MLHKNSVSAKFIVLPLAFIIASLGMFALYDYYSVGNIAETTFLNPVSPTLAKQANSNGSLLLVLRTNSSVLTGGQAILVNVSLFNVSGRSNYVPEGSDWINSDLSTGPCGSLNMPIGFAIYAGNYSMEDLLDLKPAALGLYHLGFYSCPAIFYVGGYQFQSNSDVATVFSSPVDNSSAIFTAPMSGAGSFRGSWTTGTDAFGNGAQLQNFGPGVYTVVGGDEFGDVVLLYFTVG
jgi:hypothetical protein